MRYELDYTLNSFARNTFFNMAVGPFLFLRYDVLPSKGNMQVIQRISTLFHHCVTFQSLMNHCYGDDAKVETWN